MNIGDSVHVRDLAAPNVTVLTDPETTVAAVVAPTVMEEKPAEAVAVEGATAAEPEVITKGKKDDEDGEKSDKPEKGEKGEKGEKAEKGKEKK